MNDLFKKYLEYRGIVEIEPNERTKAETRKLIKLARTFINLDSKTFNDFMDQLEDYEKGGGKDVLSK